MAGLPRSSVRSLLLLTLTAISVSPHLLAQDPASDAGGSTGKVKPVPRAKAPTPFAITQPAHSFAPAVRFTPADQMSRDDQRTASNEESSIAEHASLNGFDLSEGAWHYEQIDCPAFPGHLFLRYTRNNGASDLTVFSASIPRGQNGRVRIIPIMKRSYSLFEPAPINALTISAFNHIRAEEEEAAASSNWVGNGLCYAALAGANPQLASAEPLGLGAPFPVMDALLQTEEKGGAVIRFVDAAATPHPMAWSMVFNEKGKLVKATRSPATMVTPRLVPVTSGVIETRPVPQTAH